MKIASQGVKEIVITGVNIGDFKDKNNKRNFSDLIYELDQVKGIEGIVFHLLNLI